MKASPRCLEVNPRGLKTQEGIGRLAELTTLFAVTDCCPDQDPGGAGSTLVLEASASCRKRTRNAMRVQLIDEMRWLGSRESPWKVNPARGCGVKQTRKVHWGVTRRGREKRRGRNVGSSGDVPTCGPSVLMSRLGPKPREGCRASSDSRRIWTGHIL